MKKPISVLLSILIVFSALNALSFGVSAAESDDAAGSKTDILFGDVNGDGTVDFDDVLGINAIIGDESVSEETKIIADVNDDGAVTYADAVELKTALDNGDIYSLTIYDRLSDAGFCGKNGSNVKYIIKKDGKAIIFGSGAIKDSRISQIWLYSAEELIIKNGVTVIGANAFYNCSSVVSVEFPESLTEIKKEAFEQDYDVVLQILPNTQSLKANIFYKKNLPSGLQSTVENQMDDIFFNQLLRDSLHVEPAKFDQLKQLTKAEAVTIQIDDKGSEKEHDASVNQLFGMGCGLVIYFIIIMFASQVLRGVLEEKTNRIVEVLISSVKPMQLLIGKIVGIALVGLTQLVIWIVLSTAILGGIQLFAPTLFGTESVETLAETPGVNVPDTSSLTTAPSNIFEVIQNYFSVSFVTIILCFIFYFIVGYLIYSTLYAATGSVVDNESDSQQYNSCCWPSSSCRASPRTPTELWPSGSP